MLPVAPDGQAFLVGDHGQTREFPNQGGTDDEHQRRYNRRWALVRDRVDESEQNCAAPQDAEPDHPYTGYSGGRMMISGRPYGAGKGSIADQPTAEPAPRRRCEGTGITRFATSGLSTLRPVGLSSP